VFIQVRLQLLKPIIHSSLQVSVSPEYIQAKFYNSVPVQTVVQLNCCRYFESKNTTLMLHCAGKALQQCRFVIKCFVIVL